MRTIDKITIGKGRRGPICEAIQNEFFGIVSGERPDIHGWLTFVYNDELNGEAVAVQTSATEGKGF